VSANKVSIASLTPRGLTGVITRHSPLSSADLKSMSWEEAGNWIVSRGGAKTNELRPRKIVAKRRATAPKKRQPSQPTNYLQRVEQEVHIILCTKDKAYAGLRKMAASSQQLLVTYISIAVATTLGVTAGAITPLVALCLLSAIKVGIRAYCAGEHKKPRL
jgi:hypothetical protein